LRRDLLEMLKGYCLVLKRDGEARNGGVEEILEVSYIIPRRLLDGL
jgi:hypothetical protein